MVETETKTETKALSLEDIDAGLAADPAATVQKLDALVRFDPDNLQITQLAAEVNFELGNAEEAFVLLQKAVALDPTGDLGGFSKFLWLGQLQGGQKGLELYERGVNGLQNPSDIVNGLLGMIEIWMTDMCMAPEAESQCEALIGRALMLDEFSAEAWSILGSIRISQQRAEDARNALTKSWEYYEMAIDASALEPSQISSLVRLAQSMMEVNLHELVLDITSVIARLDDQVPDAYYLNALAHKALIPASIDALDASRHIVSARDAVELLQELPDVDPEMLADAAEAIASLPEPTVEVPSDEELEDHEELDEQ